MRYVRVLMASALVFTLCSAFTAEKSEKKGKPVYAFGIAASFNDSIVYYTEIQILDSVQLSKEGFLPKREMFSYQLKNHIEYNLKKKVNRSCKRRQSKSRGNIQRQRVIYCRLLILQHLLLRR